MRRRLSLMMQFTTAATVLGVSCAVMMSQPKLLEASSHREAPFITKNPKVDGTDFDMFQSYQATDIQADGTSNMTTLVANYIPLQDPFGGPNYFSFDPAALYEIEIDNTGDGVEDLTFQFQFTNALNPASANGVQLNVGSDMVSIPTVQANIAIGDGGANPNPITATNESSLLNVQESYTINVVRGPRRTGTVSQVTNATTQATTFVKPVDYIGSQTLGNAQAYATYAGLHQYPISIPGCTATGTSPAKVFVGQRAEGFRVNLGLIFDLVNVSNVGGLSFILGGTNRGALNFNPNAASFAASNIQFDNTALKNITSIALNIPTACLTSDGMPPSTTARPVIGGWTTASVRQARVINPNATYGLPAKEGGAWTEVSRLGMPLTNEVVIGIADKDKWNSSEPSNDAQFLNYVTNPTLPQNPPGDLRRREHTAFPGRQRFAHRPRQHLPNGHPGGERYGRGRGRRHARRDAPPQHEPPDEGFEQRHVSGVAEQPRRRAVLPLRHELPEPAGHRRGNRCLPHPSRDAPRRMRPRRLPQRPAAGR